MFLLHNDLSSVISIHHRCRFVCMIPMHWLLTLNIVIISVILFTVLFANQIMIFSTSAAPLVLSRFLNSSALAANFEQVIVPVIFNQILICFMSAARVTGFVSFAFTMCWLTLNRSLFQFYCIRHCLLTRH